MKTNINLVIKPKNMLNYSDLVSEVHRYLKLSDEHINVESIKVSKKFLNKDVPKKMWTMTAIGPYTFKVYEEKHNVVILTM